MRRILIFTTFIIVGIFLNILPIHKEFLPYLGNFDATTYIDMSESIDLSMLSDMHFLEFALGALNWFSLPLLIKIINIQNAYWHMLLINAVILYLIIRQLWHLAQRTIIPNSLFVCLCLLSMPFLWCWIFIPSKENFTVLGFLSLFNFYTLKRSKLSLPLILFLGIFKTQIIAGFLTAEFFFRIKKHYLIISFLLVNLITICIYKFTNYLSLELYLSHQGDAKINTRELILAIEQIIKIPVIGAIAVPIRAFFNLPAGVVAVKDIFISFESFLMNFSSIITGISSTFFLFHIKRNNQNEIKIFWSFLLPFLFIPFFQFRYFWWTIPILLYFILQKKEP